MIPTSPYILKSLEQLENIYTALRKNEITLSKSEAMKIVGGRYVLAQVAFAKYGKLIWYDLRSIERFMNRNKVV